MSWIVNIDGQHAGPFGSGVKAYDAMWDTLESQSTNMATIERMLSRCSLEYIGRTYHYEFYNFRTLTGQRPGQPLARWFTEWCGNVMPPTSISWMVFENPGGRLGDVLGATDCNALPKAVREMNTKLGVHIKDMVCFDVALFNMHPDALVTRCLVREKTGHSNPRRKRR